MRYIELIEDVDADLARDEEARGIARDFQHWLAANNSEVPLSRASSGYQRPMGPRDRAFLVSAYDLGLPEPYDDLSMGLQWPAVDQPDQPGETTARASLSRGWDPDTNRAAYFACFHCYGSPMDKTDIAYSLRWSEMHHELIHYLDYKRGLQKDGKYNQRRTKLIRQRSTSKTRLKDYFNDSLERNAYFMQGLHDLMNEVIQMARYEVYDRSRPDYKNSVFGSFALFKKRFLSHFEYQFLDHLTPESKRAFDKRLYKIYAYLAPAWPNAKAVQARIAKIEAAERAEEARWLEQDAQNAA